MGDKMPQFRPNSAAIEQKFIRKYPYGPEIIPSRGTHFRLWAPTCTSVSIVIETPAQAHSTYPLEPEKDGCWSALIKNVFQGTQYRFQLNNSDLLCPDPASRFQPQGPHGPSQVIDPASFTWTDSAWPGIKLPGQVLYEIHIGTFTPEGTFCAAAAHLQELHSFGITAIEIMPIADFAGTFGWGYDGVNLFAPTRLYGTGDDLKNFVNAAHVNGLAVILDVVYNHFGPDGNYLRSFSDQYFSIRYKNEWGEPINFDGPGSEHVRDFYTSNAAYWIDEFHFDGLRLDATQQMFDSSPRHILSEISDAARSAAPQRSVLVIAENEPQQVSLLKPSEQSGGCGIDALWNDDFHHSCFVALTGRSEAYYSDYLGNPSELLACFLHGFIYQGQQSQWQHKPRGSISRFVEPYRFINFLENHDQVANSAFGDRLHNIASPQQYRALTALLLLGPWTPMLFQGQEFGSNKKFTYFADHKLDLATLVSKGRKEFLSQFPSLNAPEMRNALPDPSDPANFKNCKLDHSEKIDNPVYEFHRRLLELRTADNVFANPSACRDGAILSNQTIVLWYSHETDQRLLIVNLGPLLRLKPISQPLLAAPPAHKWQIIFSTEDHCFKGWGISDIDLGDQWIIPSSSTTVMALTKTQEQKNAPSNP